MENRLAQKGTGGMTRPDVRNGWNCRENEDGKARVEAGFSVAFGQQRRENARGVGMFRDVALYG